MTLKKKNVTMTTCGCRFGLSSWFTDNVNEVMTLKKICNHDDMWVQVWAVELVHGQCGPGDDTKNVCNHDDMWVQVWAVELVHGRCGRSGDQV